MSLIGQIISKDRCGSPEPLEIKGQVSYGPITKDIEWPQISEATAERIREAMKQVEKPELEVVPAIKFMEDGVKTLKQRAALRDSSGERSMERTVEAFNALTGKGLTTAEGWEFMVLLKMVRGRQGTFHEDDYTDMCGYASLLGEEESSRPERRK